MSLYVLLSYRRHNMQKNKMYKRKKGNVFFNNKRRCSIPLSMLFTLSLLLYFSTYMRLRMISRAFSVTTFIHTTNWDKQTHTHIHDVCLDGIYIFKANRKAISLLLDSFLGMNDASVSPYAYFIQNTLFRHIYEKNKTSDIKENYNNIGFLCFVNKLYISGKRNACYFTYKDEFWSFLLKKCKIL